MEVSVIRHVAMHFASLVFLLLLVSCAGVPTYSGTIELHDVGEFKDTPLDNGLVVPIRLARVVFTDGVEGLAVDYVTPSPLGFPQVEAELPYV